MAKTTDYRNGYHAGYNAARRRFDRRDQIFCAVISNPSTKDIDQALKIVDEYIERDSK